MSRRGHRRGRLPAAKGVVEALLRRSHARVPRGRRGGRTRLFHPGKTAEIEARCRRRAASRAARREWGAFELDLETLFAAGAASAVVYEDVITYPAVHEDVAVAVDEDVEVGSLVDAAREAAGPILREARVFDVYRGEQVGEGRKSVAIHLAFQSPERTLTDEEAAEVRDRIVAALRERFGAELRA